MPSPSRSNKAAEKLKAMVSNTATVIRRDPAAALLGQTSEYLHLSLQRQPPRAPETRSRAVPGKGRHHQHLAGVSRPHHQKNRVIPDQVFGGGVERRQAQAREKEQRQRTGERVRHRHARRDVPRRALDAGHAASSWRNTKGRIPPWW